MQALLRSTARRIPRAVSDLSQKRAMSSGHSQEEVVKEMNKWRNISAVAIPTCLSLTVYTLAKGEHHHADVPKYPYLRIRSKEFPWGDCSLFDSNCEL
ncbi:hypothetical protein BSKO_00926 [Bryopsis sp. KO-2023]|nr:hypothetical protein BSKO_00926 [Bryopsis sp. KO-2023]